MFGILGQHRKAATAALAAVIGLVLASGAVLAPRDFRGQEHEVVISSGMGARELAQLLEREGIIRSELAFVGLARLTGRAQELKAGRYLLCPCDSVLELIEAISSGAAESDDVVVTIPEGLNVWDIDALLVARGLLGASGMPPRGEFAERYLFSEGRYFPDTFRIASGSTFMDLADRMYGEFLERAGEYTDEQVVVASMLEKEAKSAEDMALVAGIIRRRRELGMPLQIDATVAYGWCVRTAFKQKASCDVTQAPIATEIKKDGPYNTYTRTGLPEGPISNPGLKALNAAANPIESDYLYYLSTRDGSRLVFSKTADEHLRNRQKYLGF